MWASILPNLDIIYIVLGKYSVFDFGNENVNIDLSYLAFPHC